MRPVKWRAVQYTPRCFAVKNIRVLTGTKKSNKQLHTVSDPKTMSRFLLTAGQFSCLISLSYMSEFLSRKIRHLETRGHDCSLLHIHSFRGDSVHVCVKERKREVCWNTVLAQPWHPLLPFQLILCEQKGKTGGRLKKSNNRWMRGIMFFLSLSFWHWQRKTHSQPPLKLLWNVRLS